MYSGRINNKYIENLLFSLIGLIYFLCLFYKMNEVWGSFELMIGIFFIMAFFLTRHFILFKVKDGNFFQVFLVALELITINIIYFYTKAAVSDLIYMIFVADIILAYSVKYSIPTALLGYLAYYTLSVLKEGPAFDLVLLTNLFTRGISFTAFVLVLGYFKGVFNKNVTMQQLMNEIDKKNEALESLVLMKERNRIASEMHDTIGHTLTTSIVELEAAKMLFSIQPELAYEKLSLACEQIRKSMQEIRSVVKRIDLGQGVLEFVPSIQTLAQEVKRHTNKTLVVDMLACDLLPIQENALYSAIQESITNSIKHGDATEILVTGIKNMTRYEIQIIDNGRGCHQITKGFGLHNMSEKIKGLGGFVSLHSEENAGFRVLIGLPLQIENEDDSDV